MDKDKASSERQSKAAGMVLRVLRLLRGAEKRAKTCQIAVLKPNRNSLWRFGSARDSFEAQQKGFEAFGGFKGC